MRCATDLVSHAPPPHGQVPAISPWRLRCRRFMRPAPGEDGSGDGGVGDAGGDAGGGDSEIKMAG